MAVYMLNCLDETIKTLSLYEFVDDWLERLQIGYTEPSNLINKFENYLSTPHMLILPQVNWILNSLLRIDVQKRGNEVIIAIYKQLYKSVVDPINLYQDPYSLMPHSVADVESMLLSVEKNNEPIQI